MNLSRVLRRPPREIVANDAKVVLRYMSEHRAAGAFAQSPDVRRARLQPFVHANKATHVQVDAGRVEPDARSVRNAARCDKDMAAINRLLARIRLQRNADRVSRLAFHFEKLESRHES